MEPIRDTAQRLIRNWLTKRQKETEDILGDALRKLLTPKERRHITFYSLRDSRIILNVDSSAWFYLLNVKKEQLLKNLNQILKPSQAIVEILLRLDRNETKSPIKR